MDEHRPSDFSITSRIDSGRMAFSRPEYRTSQRATMRRTAADRTVLFGRVLSQSLSPSQ
jgi:hypothetical protein